MTRTMYDSVTVKDIPKDAKIVAGYVDGSYRNIQEIRQRFPHIIHVSITVTGRDLSANVVDCEKGDTTPASAADWARRKINAKAGHPTIYCSLSVWASVKNAVAHAGLKPTDVSYWIAHYDNKAVLPAGAVAKQYKSTTKPNLDTSVVADYWAGVDAPPPPKKAPAPAPVKKAAPVAPKHPAPHPVGPSSRQGARAALLARIKKHRDHLLHLLHLRNHPPHH